MVFGICEKCKNFKGGFHYLRQKERSAIVCINKNLVASFCTDIKHYESMFCKYTCKFTPIMIIIKRTIICKKNTYFRTISGISLTKQIHKNKVSKGAKIRSRYNQVPHPTQDTNGKVTNSQLDTTNESQEVSPFSAGDHKAHVNRRAQSHSKHKTE